jgi:signal peptidase I
MQQADTSKAAEKRAPTPWRDNLEAVAMAVIMALLLKYFVVEAYKIPSGSMQPTLIGDDQAGVYDRILVDKLSYKFRDPKRFEVVVFKYPLDLSKSFVKRLVGIGPEEIKIVHGDLWRRDDASQPWTILRRPRAVQIETWKRLDREDPDEPRWFVDPQGPAWETAPRRIVAHGPGRARFGDQQWVMDAFLDGYPDGLRDLVRRKQGTGIHPVGDLRVEGEVVADAATEEVAVELYEGQMRYRLSLPGPAAPEGARPAIRLRSGSRFASEAEVKVVKADRPLRLEAGRRYAFGAQNLDDLLELELDGEVLVRHEIANAADQRAFAYVVVEGAGARVELDELMAYRDIYYTGGDLAEYSVPAGHYFMLGDNTQDSSDGREWKVTRLDWPVSDSPGAGVEVVTGSTRRDDQRPWQANPWRRNGLEGPMIRFRDVYGEVRWLRGAQIPYASPPSENVPFVPRRLVQGRALAVFWPWSPRLGVYRWKWIH